MKNKREKSTWIIIGLAFIMALSGIYFIIVKTKESPTPEPQETTKTISTTQPAGDKASASEETPSPQKSNADIDNTTLSFIELYNSYNDGSYQALKQKTEKLKEKITPKGWKTLLNLELLEADPSTFMTHENIISVKYKDPKVYVTTQTALSTEKKIVLVKATQEMYRLNKKVNAFPFIFVGTFVYDTTSHQWLCDSISENGLYSKGTGEYNTPKGEE